MDKTAVPFFLVASLLIAVKGALSLDEGLAADESESTVGSAQFAFLIRIGERYARAIGIVVIVWANVGPTARRIFGPLEMVPYTGPHCWLPLAFVTLGISFALTPALGMLGEAQRPSVAPNSSSVGAGTHVASAQSVGMNSTGTTAPGVSLVNETADFAEHWNRTSGGAGGAAMGASSEWGSDLYWMELAWNVVGASATMCFVKHITAVAGSRDSAAALQERVAATEQRQISATTKLETTRVLQFATPLSDAWALLLLLSLSRTDTQVDGGQRQPLPEGMYFADALFQVLVPSFSPGVWRSIVAAGLGCILLHWCAGMLLAVVRVSKSVVSLWKAAGALMICANGFLTRQLLQSVLCAPADDDVVVPLFPGMVCASADHTLAVLWAKLIIFVTVGRRSVC